MPTKSSTRPATASPRGPVNFAVKEGTNMTSPNDLVVVYAGDPFEADYVKWTLENNGIQAFLKDEILGSIAPYYTAGGLGAVKVTVAQRDIEEANEIIQQINKMNSEE